LHLIFSRPTLPSLFMLILCRMYCQIRWVLPQNLVMEIMNNRPNWRPFEEITLDPFNSAQVTRAFAFKDAIIPRNQRFPSQSKHFPISHPTTSTSPPLPIYEVLYLWLFTLAETLSPKARRWGCRVLIARHST